ncbi:protein transport protein bos1 [Malassezia vespertilionis]|uniref:protein transport protein bos1 n=1 Tax=Malassezia vespertilionis TaxID=2020962 RepID=UPI0024B0E42E|nr:protein transport protein bos1 [Malassezia vespertilionis]WFD05830.1 protein transport protein bos1 [Malassezia vespertilionis]
MNSLYNLAVRQEAAVRADIGVYNADPTAARRAQISAAIATLLKTVEDYEGMAKRELVIAKREKALARATSFREMTLKMREELNRVPEHTMSSPVNAVHAATAMDTAQVPRARAIDMTGASAPFVVTSTPQMPTLPAYARPTMQHNMPNMYGQGNMQQASDPLMAYKVQPNYPNGYEPGSSYSMRENHALREHSFIQSTEVQLDAFISQGRSVLNNLVEQRGILKGTRRRLLDAANKVGLSRELIGIIDRVSAQDSFIFGVGAVFTLFAFFMIYRWFG